MDTLQDQITPLNEDEIDAVAGGVINISELNVTVAGPMSVSVNLGGSTLTISATSHSHGVTWS
ncbi:MAG: hypothetical protein ACRETC_12080 [Gammaproteobacteria bacterium]